jgi:hypothetical protein
MLAMLLAVGVLGGATRADMTLVDNGQAKATIVIAQSALGVEPKPTQFNQPLEAPIKIAAAARDLQLYIEKMSGAKLPIVGDDQPVPAGVLILVGRSALTKPFDAQIPSGLTPTRDEEGYLMLSQGNRLLLAGNDAPYYHGTEYATYAFLNSLGVRWYMPGEFGEFIPRHATIKVGDLNVTSRPDFKMRNWWGPSAPALAADDYRWKIRNGMNPILRFVELPGDSTVRRVLPPAKELNNPEFAEVWGKDAKGQPNIAMPNLSSEQSVQYAVDKICEYFRANPTITSFGIGADDGLPVDYSPETQKRNLGMTDIGGEYGTEAPITDEWMNWIQEVAQGVYKEFPDHIITTNGYSNRNTPPLNVQPDPKIWIMFAAIWSDTMHAYDNPRSWQTMRQAKMIEQWCKLYNNVYMYNYIYYMLAGAGEPIALSHKTAHDMPLYKKWGVVGFSDEGRTVRTETGVFPTYLRARMMWNAGLDVNKERDEFFANWYGPAARPAMAFWEELENTFETTPWLGHEDRILPYVYSPALIAKLEQDVKAAEALATDEWSKPRVHADRITLENLKAYMAMNRAEFDANFAEAARQAQRMIDVRTEAAQLSPFYYNPDPKRNGDSNQFYYWGAWQRGLYYQKVAKATNGTTGDLVSILPEQAKCKLDPRDDGRYDHWFAPDYKDDDWTAVQTTMPFYRQVAGGCDDTGYPYIGALWYRQEFELPASAKGKNLYLYAAAIEPEAWVWINGKFIGHREYHDCYERPNALDMDVSNALIPGKKNVIAIRVHTGLAPAALADGLCSRLFLYSPRDKPISQQ